MRIDFAQVGTAEHLAGVFVDDGEEKRCAAGQSGRRGLHDELDSGREWIGCRQSTGPMLHDRVLAVVVRNIADLRAASDDDLIAEHDRHAGNTHVGTGYYMDELDRRDRNRMMLATERLARNAYRLSVVNAVLAFIAVVAAIAALLK